MPDGWVVHSKTGKPINDPKEVGEGVLLPIGDHKGSGLALIIGLLAGVLNGAAFGRDVVDFTGAGSEKTNTGQFMVAIDVARFIAAGGVRRRDGPPSQRSALVGDGCPASTRSGCRARTAASAAPSAPGTASRCRPTLVKQLDDLAANLKIKPLGREQFRTDVIPRRREARPDSRRLELRHGFRFARFGASRNDGGEPLRLQLFVFATKARTSGSTSGSSASTSARVMPGRMRG